MATRVISTSIKLDGEQEFKKQLSDVNSNLRTLKSEMQLTTEEFKGQANSLEALEAKDRILTDQIAQQTEKVRALEDALDQVGEVYENQPKKVDEYQQSLNRAKTELVKMQRELEDNARYMDEARNSADKAAKSIDGFGKEVKEAGSDKNAEGIGDLVGSLGKLKDFAVGGVVGAAAIGGLTAIKDAIFEIVDGTEEYRSIMGTLEVSSQTAGYSAEQTAEAYNRLYGVLGDTQTAATTVANLQAIGLSQQDLMMLIDASTGAWATYGDSIPIDSLAESINETVKAGEVTGTFADVLNWAGTNEDEFNAKLADAKSSSERANIVLKELSDQGLKDVGQAWRDVNGDIVKANEAQAKWEEATGKLGETLSPAKDALLSFGADAVEYVTGLIKDAVGAVQDLLDWFGRINDKLNKSGDDRMEEYGYEAYYNEEGLKRYRKVDGSHAGGLSYVPYDGYVAELHEGESVLTEDEADTWRMLRSSPIRVQQGVTAQDLQSVTAAAVNAMGTMQQGSAGGDLRIELSVNGQKFSEAILPDFRKVSKANPEVVNDT